VKPTVCGEEVVDSDDGTLADTESPVAEVTLGTAEALLAGAEVSDGSEVSRL
jgi:hypothetical protein